MVKKIAVINDLSGFGRCSLTAAISVLSCMGVQPCPLPTAILSGQTGYPSFYCDDYTEKMEYFRREWKKMNVTFDGIYTGYVADEAQISQIFRFLDTFYRKDGNSAANDTSMAGKKDVEQSGSRQFLLVDPVMGDEGNVYKMFTPGLLEQMKRLAARADIITPNLTELCLLTGNDFQKLKRLTDKNELLKAVEQMAREMMAQGPHIVVVTGIRFTDSADGKAKIGNLAVAESSRLFAFPYVGGSFSGTGDLFASVLTGGMARGNDIFQSVELAGEFIELAMKDAVAEGVERNDGANYEKYLGMLIPSTEMGGRK